MPCDKFGHSGARRRCAGTAGRIARRLVSFKDANYVLGLHGPGSASCGLDRVILLLRRIDMGYYLTIGAVLGLSAGFAPGPLLTLVISETLRHGIRSGIRVALAPVVTDFPIILLTLFVLSRLSSFHGILGIISIAGGVFILSMGYESVRAKGFDLQVGNAQKRSLRKGILANMLSPHPYLFWFSVGAPTMTKALVEGPWAPAAFVAGFYACLIGAKIALAVLVGSSRSFFRGAVYVWTMRTLGLVLIVLALLLFRDGFRLLGFGGGALF